MTAPITGMYCDRCGARHEFGRARPGGVARLRELTRGVRGYVMNEAPTFGDAMTDAWARLEEDGALEQYAEVHKTFSFCLDCRGYVCHDCWNTEAGRCLTCVPLPGTEAAAEALIAGRLDLVAGPADATLTPAPPATPAEVAGVAETVEPPPAGMPGAPAPFGTTDAAVAGAGVETVDAVARLAEMGLAPGQEAVGPEVVDAESPSGVERGGGTVGPSSSVVAPPSPAETAVAAAGAGIAATPRVHRVTRTRKPARPVVPSADEDADVIAAAVAAGIILPPTAPAPATPEPIAEGALAAAADTTTSPAPTEAEPEATLAEAPIAEAEAAEAVLAEPLAEVSQAEAAELTAEAVIAEPQTEAAAVIAEPEAPAAEDAVLVEPLAEVPEAEAAELTAAAVIAEPEAALAEPQTEAAAVIAEPEAPAAEDAVLVEPLAEVPEAEAAELTAAAVIAEPEAALAEPEAPTAEAEAAAAVLVAPPAVIAETQDIPRGPEPGAAIVVEEILPSDEGGVDAASPASATVPAWPSGLRTPVPVEPPTPGPAGRVDATPAAETTVAPVAPATEPAATTPTPRRAADRRRPAPPPRRSPAPVHCRHCGLQVPAVARFCRRCGGAQAQDVAVPT